MIPQHNVKIQIPQSKSIHKS